MASLTRWIALPEAYEVAGFSDRDEWSRQFLSHALNGNVVTRALLVKRYEFLKKYVVKKSDIEEPVADNRDNDETGDFFGDDFFWEGENEGQKIIEGLTTDAKLSIISGMAKLVDKILIQPSNDSVLIGADRRFVVEEREINLDSGFWGRAVVEVQTGSAFTACTSVRYNSVMKYPADTPHQALVRKAVYERRGDIASRWFINEYIGIQVLYSDVQNLWLTKRPKHIGKLGRKRKFDPHAGDDCLEKHLRLFPDATIATLADRLSDFWENRRGLGKAPGRTWLNEQASRVRRSVVAKSEKDIRD